jgi:hypothetical protein
MLILVVFLILVLGIGFIGKSKKITGSDHPFKYLMGKYKNKNGTK